MVECSRGRFYTQIPEVNDGVMVTTEKWTSEICTNATNNALQMLGD